METSRALMLDHYLAAVMVDLMGHSTELRMALMMVVWTGYQWADVSVLHSDSC